MRSLLLRVWFLPAAAVCAVSGHLGTSTRNHFLSFAWRDASNALHNPVVILPGFGNSYGDYVHAKAEDGGSMVDVLKKLGVAYVDVPAIERMDWLNIVKGFTCSCVWRSSCSPEDLFKFYLDAVDESVNRAYTATGHPAILVGHSAGGWLARALLADGSWRGQKRGLLSSEVVTGLVTLGTPHHPPSSPTVDHSRGALTYVNSRYPGAYLKERYNIFYVTVAGTAVKGNGSASAGAADFFAASSYRLVAGSSKTNGNEVGDGIVPVSAAHLEGAEQLNLENIWHGSLAPNVTWYGSTVAVSEWLPVVIREARRTSTLNGRSGILRAPSLRNACLLSRNDLSKLQHKESSRF